MLTSAATRWPVYLDPNFTGASTGGTKASAVDEAASAFVTDYYNNLPDGGYLQVGYDGWSTGSTDRSFMTMPVPAEIYGATVLSATLNITEHYAPACDSSSNEPTWVDLYTTGAISHATQWSHQPAWIGSALASANVAHGYDSSCPAAGVPFTGTLQGFYQNVARAQTATFETFGLRARDESSKWGWKEFQNNPTLTIIYDHGPDIPSGLHTSVTPSCAGGIIGDGTVALYGTLTHPDWRKGAVVYATFTLWKTSDAGKTPIAGSGTEQKDAYSNDTPAPFVVTMSAL
jgi:hypothetical protein